MSLLPLFLRRQIKAAIRTDSLDFYRLFWCTMCSFFFPSNWNTDIGLRKMFVCLCVCVSPQCLKQYVELLIKEGLETAISCPDSACPKRGHLQENEVSKSQSFTSSFADSPFSWSPVSKTFLATSQTPLPSDNDQYHFSSHVKQWDLVKK